MSPVNLPGSFLIGIELTLRLNELKVKEEAS